MRRPKFKAIPHDQRKPPKELPLDDLLLYASRSLMLAAYEASHHVPRGLAALHEHPSANYVRRIRRLAAELAERGRNIKHPKKPKLRFSEAVQQVTAPLSLLDKVRCDGC